MNITNTKEQILINRSKLNNMYAELTQNKHSKRIADEQGWLDTEHYFHNVINKLKPRIAKLVVLQKALKKDLAREIFVQNWADRQSDLKYLMQDQAGEVYE
jgi:hypothetical protein